MPDNIRISELIPIDHYDETTYVPVVMGQPGAEINRKLNVNLLGGTGTTGGTFLIPGDGINIDEITISVDGTVSRTGHTHSQYALVSDLNNYAFIWHNHDYDTLDNLPDIQGMIDNSISGFTGGTTYVPGFGIDISGTTISIDESEVSTLFLTGYTETDPIFIASPAHSITNNMITNINYITVTGTTALSNTTMFIGPDAGKNSVPVGGLSYSTFVGSEAGYGALGSANSVFIGPLAGKNAKNSGNLVAIGLFSGENASGSTSSLFLGYSAGYDANTTDSSVFIGTSAGRAAYTTNKSTFIGNEAGFFSANSNYNTYIGYRAGFNNPGKTNNIIIGNNRKLDNSNAFNIGGLIFGINMLSPTGSTSYGLAQNGKVGVNILNPTEALHVSGNTLVTGTIYGSNLSGINTGDETNQRVLNLLGITGITGYNSGDETVTSLRSKLDDVYASINHSHTGMTGGTFTETDPIYESEKHLYSLTGHTHSGLTYTETDPIYQSEKSTLALKIDLDGYSQTGHTHNQYLTSFIETDPLYMAEKITLALKTDLNGFSLSGHTHDDRYYTETETTNLLNGKANKTIQITGVTIYSSGWTSGTTYEYVYNHTGITDVNIVDIIPEISTYPIVKAANMYPMVTSSAGSVKLYSGSRPTSNIIITLNIFE